MAQFVFVGARTELPNLKLERFGQAVELPEAAAENIIAGGGALLPKDDFDALGFTEQEVSLYAYPAPRAQAPQVFHVKYSEAIARFAELHETIKSGGHLTSREGAR